MPPQGFQFTKGPFQNVPFLIQETETLYREQIIPKGGPDRFRAAADRCIDHRGWRPALPLIKDNVEPILRELNIFYVPKQLQPGPGFVFPKTDATGATTGGKFNPYGWELRIGDNPAKYASLGNGYEFVGPSWIGNSDRVLQGLIEKRVVFLVEGPWDLVACRVLVPDAPVLCPETKNMNEMHFVDLKMAGVKTLAFMFDNEFSTRPETGVGAGQYAQARLAKVAAAQYGFRTQLLMCPAHDPSDCLRSPRAATALKNALRTATEVNILWR